MKKLNEVNCDQYPGEYSTVLRWLSGSKVLPAHRELLEQAAKRLGIEGSASKGDGK